MNCQNNLFEFDKNFINNNKTGALQIEVQNYKYVIGTDEAGRGPGAGSVYAACVLFFDNVPIDEFKKLNDSKKLSEKTRIELYHLIKKYSFYSVKSVDIKTIDEINILNSSLLAMKLAILDVINKAKINKDETLLLIDGNRYVDIKMPKKTVIGGDGLSASIAAASILAKVERDFYMEKLDEIYPNYDFKNNKGYLTKKHIEAIKKYGVTKVHRMSFLKNILQTSKNHV